MQRRKHKALEVSGRDIDEAIAKGLTQLGMARDEVLIEILNRGRRRLFGLSTEPAQVRILYPVSEEEESEAEITRQVVEDKPASTLVDEVEEKLTSTPVEKVADEPIPASVERIEETEQITQIYAQQEPDPSSPEDDAKTAQATVRELLERMGIEAQVIVHEPQEDQILSLDITGEDLGVLIGPQGETLNALQYIARLVVSRELLHWVTFFLDVEGFRQRRAKELQDLALRMAERVALSKQPLALEPMPAHERRLIHIALRNHPLAASESVGQGEHRRVTILHRE